MKKINIEQRSDEWLEFRKGKITGTKAKDFNKPRYITKAELVAFATARGYVVNERDTIAKIREAMSDEHLHELDYTVVMSDNIYKLLAEVVARPITPNDYTEKLNGEPFSMMSRGKILEDEALNAFNLKTGMEFTAGSVWQSEDNESIIVSPDAELVESDDKIKQAVEIKCLDSWKQLKAFYEDQPPEEYRPQILQYFLVNEDLEQLHFVMYSDVFAKEELSLLVFTIERADIEEELDFAKHMQLAVIELVEKEAKGLVL